MCIRDSCKLCLVVRQETDGIRRYAHLATGNYNRVTSQIYTDVGLFTADERILNDVSEAVSYTHLRAHETVLDLVCRLLLEKKKQKHNNSNIKDEKDHTNNKTTKSCDLNIHIARVVELILLLNH